MKESWRAFLGKLDMSPVLSESVALFAVDAKTGKILWQREDRIFGTLLALSQPHDVLLMSYQPSAFKLDSEGGRERAGVAVRIRPGMGLCARSFYFRPKQTTAPSTVERYNRPAAAINPSKTGADFELVFGKLRAVGG